MNKINKFSLMTLIVTLLILLMTPGLWAQVPGQNVPSNLKVVDPSEDPQANPPTSVVSSPNFNPKPIVVEKIDDPLENRLDRRITLDVREMNTVDVLKFLALKGSFNMVTAGNISGRVTLYLKDVSIKDALDIVIISNDLGYHVENNIIHVMKGEEYLALFGKKFNDKNKVEIIQLKYAKPSYVLAALDNIKSNLGRIIIDEDTGTVVMIDTPDSIVDMKEAINEMESPLQPVVYTLQYAKADVVAEKLKERIDAHSVGSIMTDQRSNKLIVRAYPHRQAEVKEMIMSMDAPTMEVLIEARVLQVAFKPKLDWGIDWQEDFRKSDRNPLNKLNFSNIFLDEDNLTSSDNLYSNYGKFAIGDIDVNQFEISIRALKQVSDTKILSNPKILVTNNEEAKIHVGDTVPYIISTTSGTGDNAITSEDVRFTDVGLKLNVTPSINKEGFVTMALKPEISEVVGSIESQGGGIPQVNKTLVETTVMVKDGQTIVIGGLRKENKIATKKGVPILMDIPFIKKLFSSQSESIEATEIVIFITPHIVTGEQDYSEYRGMVKARDNFQIEKDAPEKQILTIKE